MFIAAENEIKKEEERRTDSQTDRETDRQTGFNVSMCFEEINGKNNERKDTE